MYEDVVNLSHMIYKSGKFIKKLIKRFLKEKYLNSLFYKYNPTIQFKESRYKKKEAQRKPISCRLLHHFAI